MKPRRAFVFASAFALAACATPRGEAIDPALVGRYEQWGIDTGAFLELAADGTWQSGEATNRWGIGFWGRWRVVGERLELLLTSAGFRHDPSRRSTVTEAEGREYGYPERFALAGVGAATEVRSLTGPRVTWERIP